MRIERLELLRFGRFTDRALDFPLRGLDFHLIVGANEAGKSTVRAAIADLLFGIETRTPYGFLHDYDELRLGAVIAKGERREAFQRIKRAKSPLRDLEDRPLRDDLLVPFLGEMDRAAFERMFGLDHERLVRGGGEILSARDDVARLLFETSSGIGHLGELRDALEAEAKSLWDKRRSGDRAFYRAHAEWQEAERRLKLATVRARDWVEHEKRVQSARAALREAREAHRRLELERARLERVRRVAPALQKLRADEAALAALGPVARLPSAARADLAEAERDIAAAEAVLAQAARARAEADARAEAAEIDAPCLDSAAEIRALAERRARLLDHAGDIEKRRAELQARIEDARRIARRLGWEGDEAALERMLPPQSLIADLRELLQARGALTSAAESAAQQLRERRAELELLERQLAGLEIADVGPALRVAVQAARAAGDLEQQIAEAQQRTEALRARLRERLAELAPWSGSLEALRVLAVPRDEEADAQRAEELRLRTALEAQREALERTSVEEAESRARSEHLRRSRRPVTLEAIDAARQVRDELWREVRARRMPLDAAADEFEERIAAADRLADQRFGGASDIAALDQLEGLLAQIGARRERQASLVAALERELEAQRSAWHEAMRRAGLEGLSAARLPEWSRRRAACLEQATRLTEAEAALAALEGRAAAPRSALAAALGPAGASSGLLRVLLDQAEARVRGAEASAAQRSALLEREQQARAAVRALEARARDAEGRLAAWQQRWSRQVTALQLSPDTGPAAASQALDLLGLLERALHDARELRRNRIEAMQHDLDEFAAAAARLAARLAPQLAAGPPERIALELERRLREAHHQAEQRAAALQESARQGSVAEEARAARERAGARLRPLLAQSGAADLAALRAAIEASERLQALEAAIESSREACRKGGDGLALDALEAEAAAEDLGALPAKLGQLVAEVGASGESQQSLMRELTRAEAELERYGGQADAALAEGARQEALAAMAEAIERYVKVFVAARLLRWCIDRYREEKQGPLLKRASELFGIVTRGSFERLIVDHDGKTPQLKGCRCGGKLVDVAGMSEGTRDQLYLALRLAALELQLDHGRALPFVADDLFINFDDGRAAAGFQALAELAGQTQVIYLTHHEHLVPVVEQAIGPPINVVRLD